MFDYQRRFVEGNAEIAACQAAHDLGAAEDALLEVIRYTHGPSDCPQPQAEPAEPP